MTKSRAHKAVRKAPKATHGGKREGAGAPFKADRCACGEMSIARALARCPRRHNKTRCYPKSR